MALKTLKEIEGFGSKNIALISATFIVLLVFAFAQKPFNSGDNLAALTPPQPNQYVALNGATGNTTSQAAGAVLGSSTLDPQMTAALASIQVNTSNDNSDSAITNYKQQVAVVLTNDLANQLLAEQSSDPVKKEEDKVLSDLEKIVVPNSFIDYQRMLLMYYGLAFSKQSGTLAQSGVSDSDYSTVSNYFHSRLLSIGLLPS